MKVTLNWLKEYLKTDKLDAEGIADVLTMSGTEVKKIEDIGEKYKNIVIGRIVDFFQHPEADKLSVCKVDIGKNKLNIICGAKNFKKQDYVAVALEGSNILGHKIRKTKIRGQISEGMICSEKELNISNEASGIMVLGDNPAVGISFSKYAGLDDIVMELEITPNRPDCLSVVGLAREISALTKISFLPPQYNLRKEINIDTDFIIKIEDYILCPRYSVKVFNDIPGLDSPLWLKNRLTLCDIRPIDLIVDLTNYVMLETGQPMHAFDKDLLYSDKIIVRRAKKKESLKTIDDCNRILDEDMMVIADEKKPVAIAGIMGGKDTEINPNTKNVLLESANFNGSSIMKTSKKVGLRTEASNRFEKKLDPDLTVIAIKRFEDLLKQVSGYISDKGIYDNYRATVRERNITLRAEKVKQILGKEIKTDNISDILAGLGIENKVEDNIINTKVPSFRYEDLEREIDLIEEIARIYGYHKFDSLPPQNPVGAGKYSEHQKIIKNIRQSLCDIGLTEVINYSFLSKSLFEKFGLDRFEEFGKPVKILNPITEDFELLRSTLLPLMIKNIKTNINYNLKDIKIFEISKVFREKKNSKLPDEINMLGIMLSGRADVKGWNKKERYFDYYDLKGILEYIFEKYMGKNSLKIEEKEYNFFHPKISGKIIVNDFTAGIIGKINPILLDEFEINQEVYYLDLSLDRFVENIKTGKKYKPIAPFPSVEIDLAIVVNEDIKNQDIENEIINSGTNILKDIRLFDLYRGKQIEEGKKSMAYSLVFREDNRTLKDREVEIIVERILENLRKKFNAILRS